MNIAQGIYARAALVRNDYKTAQKMAHDARQGYPIMSIEDYMAGFAKPTSEWMWTNSGESQGVYFASFGATYACNGAYPCLWGSIGAGAIDNDLIEAAGEDDMRGDIFFSPRNFSSSDIKKRFWQSSSCNAQTMNINKKSGGLHNEFVRFCRLMYENVELNGWYPPYTYQGYPLGNDFTTCTAQFGAQFKFWGTDGYSASFFPFMRASEMLLIEAEAAWQNNDEGTARKVLDELNKERIYAYVNTKSSGDQLMEEIRISRRMELWGEGFSWFDFKRWNMPINRNKWENGKQDSGNWPASVAGPYKTSLSRGWRWRIPSTEYNYNHAIDQAEANEGSEDDLMP